ncbi:hypothetical protein [Roseovarius spongiae]|uniref:hypothetical protein n=1 Tax=Roseovarius spongiae TaxID=2320272 RepID=UPI001FE56BC4|nr:hypothetical protein [Roseovarius spongiae]
MLGIFVRRQPYFAQERLEQGVSFHHMVAPGQKVLDTLDLVAVDFFQLCGGWQFCAFGRGCAL